MLAGGSPPGGNYSGAGVSAGVFMPSLAGIGTHNITYMYFDPSTGCTAGASQNITVDACTGADGPDGLLIEMFPNPVTDLLNIRIAGIAETLQMRIFTVEGQVIFNEMLGNDNPVILRSIDVGKLSSGLYYIWINGEKTSKVEKILID
jgi:hypothetical protein